MLLIRGAAGPVFLLASSITWTHIHLAPGLPPMTDAAASESTPYPLPPLHTALFASMTGWVASCAVPLVRPSEQGYYVRGTGTLFEVADERFLITAAHVLSESAGTVLRDILLVNRDRTATVALEDPTLLSRGGRLDPDVAIVHLRPDTATRLQEVGGFTFLGPDHLWGPRTVAAAGALVCGYPAALSPPSPDLRCLRPTALMTGPYMGNTDGLPFEYTPGTHVLLELRDHGWAPGAAQPWPEDVPRLDGISGCSVLVIGVSPEQQERGRREGRVEPIFCPDAGLKLIGVEVGVFPRRGMIRATGWVFVAQIIGARCPWLQPVFERAYAER